MDADELEPGDLIEIFRETYQHWAVYIGGGYVVHLVAPGKFSSGASSTVSGGSVRGQVVKVKLQDVINKDKWTKNNLHDNKWKPRSKQAIVKEALSMVDKAVKYSLTDRNCEHFATWCRYGKPESAQAVGLKTAIAVVAVGVGIMFLINVLRNV